MAVFVLLLAYLFLCPNLTQGAPSRAALKQLIDDLTLTIDELNTKVEDLSNCVSCEGGTTLTGDERDCSEISQKVSTSGVYSVKPKGGSESFEVYCDMDTGTGGWTVFQRRQDGTEVFYRDWNHYREGFGDLDSEFWLGNEKIYQLTSDLGTHYQLMIELEDWEGNIRYAYYDNFRVGDGHSKYKLSVGPYSGTAVVWVEFLPFWKLSSDRRYTCSALPTNVQIIPPPGKHKVSISRLRIEALQLGNMAMFVLLLAYLFLCPSLSHQGAPSRADLKELIDDLTKRMDEQDNMIDELNMKMEDQNETIAALSSCITCEGCTLTGDERDCSEISQKVSTSGVYSVKPKGGSESFEVYCDMDTGTGGWTVFQRRQDGTEDFYRDWNRYREGFGDLDNEFWLGNEKIYQLTSDFSTHYQLMVELEDWEGNIKYAFYDNFRVGDSDSKYKLSVGQYSGTAGDSLTYHNGMQFSTMDADHDAYSSNCAVKYHGAWWYKSCHNSNLNGKYLHGTTTEYATSVTWYHWKKHYYSFKRSEMKVKSMN
ncbi:uncharacterized protein LOC144445219 [Glandiceps talaboti]